ncbi:MAG: YggS family pyridoxal phosphate-dependent enzyme [Cyclonatronaceae bacterium]
MIQKNLKLLNETMAEICAECGRSPQEIRLIAVTKTHPEQVIMEAYEAGIRDFGENKVQELVPKMNSLPDDISWHMVGTIQTNKIKDLVGRVDWIHSISKTKYLKELEKRAARIDRIIRVLIQVNISGEDQKSGCEPEQLPQILEYAAGLNHVTVHGLMGMAALSADRDQIRGQFRMLRRLRDEHRRYETDTIRLDELSMGMSGDYDIAIEEGATMIRLGTVLFGSRDYNN